MQFIKLAFVASTCLVARSAAAQPAAPDPSPQQVLPNVLSTAAGATIDGRIDYSRFIDDSDFGPPLLLAFNLHGQYIAPIGLGGYLSLPIAYAADENDSETAVGNLELGGLYVHRGDAFDAYARGGVAFDQTNSGDEGILLVFANFAPRTADTITTGFPVSWLRGGAGLRLTNGALVGGASGGIDMALDSESNLDGVLHLSGSIGVAQPSFGLAVGATLVHPLVEEGDSDGVFGVQAIADVPAGSQVRVYGALGLFLDDGVDVLSFGLGLRVGL
jgi:hypothetical protein